jgi:preprotein translocase subunit SecF
MIELLPKNTKIDFVRLFPFAVMFSLLLLGLAIFKWNSTGESKFGIDFVGGHEILVRIQTPTTADELRALFSAQGLDNASIQSFEVGSNDYSVRLSGQVVKANADEVLAPAEEIRRIREKVQQVLNVKFASAYEIQQSDFIGPSIGQELAMRALWAVMLGLVGILIYVTIRFEFAFALGAIVALFHDVIISVGIYLLAGHELNSAALAAVLTIIGYSVNDTIVIFDRVREEIIKRKDFDLRQVLNEANNACLSRTIITGGLTMITALSLFYIGGGAISDLSLLLVAGTIVGSYSTIFIACPVVLFWDQFRNRRQVATASAAKA